MHQQNNLKKKQEFRVIGMMSGTSLDGVDLALCHYSSNNIKWQYKIIKAITYPYPQILIKSISCMQNPTTTFLQFYQHQLAYSEFIVDILNQFAQSSEYDIISMHGHTIFHQPTAKLTIQCGNIGYIAAKMKKNVVGNFRQLDVYRGGEGAPLAPFGEQLFENIGELFLNLGGIANIGFKGKGSDINFCNLMFNHFANIINGSAYDKDGQNGRKGRYSEEIEKYFQQKWMFKLGHSLSRQQFQTLSSQISCKFSQNCFDIITTFYEFLAKNIIDKILEIVAKIEPGRLSKQQNVKVICTGGGSYNKYLLECIQRNIKGRNIQFTIGSKDVVQFKQAILFGLLGVKFITNSHNCEHGIGGTMAKGQTC